MRIIIPDVDTNDCWQSKKKSASFQKPSLGDLWTLVRAKAQLMTETIPKKATSVLSKNFDSSSKNSSQALSKSTDNGAMRSPRSKS